VRLDRVAWHRLTYDQTSRVRELVGQRYAPATSNRILSALRAVLKETWRLGLMSAEGYQRAADLANVRGSSLPRGRYLEPAEVERLYGACRADQTAAGARDGAAIALLHAAGLRRGEAAGLDVAAVDLRTGAVTVIGKGQKQRVCYLGPALAWLQAWLAVRGTEPGALLVDVAGNEPGRRRLSTTALYGLVTRRAAEAGLPATTPHDLRRTFATELLDAGADIALVQQLLGHASVQTTTIYDRRGEPAKLAAQRRLFVPAVTGGSS
jgi:site-specific recombinase XerD